MGCRRTIVPLLVLLLVVMLVMGAVGCGVKNQSDGSEDRRLSPVERGKGSESIVFTRNDDQELGFSGNDRCFIIDKAGDSTVRIDNELLFRPIKAPGGNSLAYLPMKTGFRELALYESDTGSERVFRIADTIEGAFGIGPSELLGFSWAPDGRSVYICASGAPDASGVYAPVPILFRYYLDSGSVEEISLEHPGAGVSINIHGVDELSSVDRVVVSPSGTRIILNQFWCGDLYEQSVRNIRKIIPEPTEANGQIYPYTSPIWLNDREIIYIEGPERDLIKNDIDTGVKTIVLKSTPEIMLGWAPRAVGIPLACSPEGDRILFPVITDLDKYAESETCISPLYVINADGTGLTQVTDPAKDGAVWGDTWPCWASR